MAESDEKETGESIITGSVKWFNLVKGFGFITRDDSREDIFVHQTAIQANGYRSLEEGEKVRFMITESDKGKVAVLVTSRDGGSVKGASRKSRIKKGARKYTNKCFNCNATGHRVKSCPYEKKDSKTCHNCGSQEHLILKCPKLVKGLKKMVNELTDLKKENELNNTCTEEMVDKNNNDS